ncbi:MAG: hypothetical protein PWR24_1856 [Desulfonauticus sp.]|jgi:PAS domain S-box-containing protein|nr:hypothetical protein [Desulfonauticus sp.]
MSKKSSLPILGYLLIILLALPSLVKAKVEKVVVLGGTSYAPFIFLDAKQQPQGIFVDFWKLWSQKTKVKVEFKLTTFKQALELVQKEENHVLSGFFYSQEREKYFDFSVPYLKIDTTIFFHKNILGLKDLSSLAGFDIGVIKGDFAEEYLKNHFPSYNLEPFPTVKELFRAVFEHKIKVFILDKPTGLFFLSQKKEGEEFRYLTKPIYTQKVVAGVKKGNPELLNLINSGFSQITDKESKEILKQWSGEYVLNKKKIYQFILALTVIIVLFLLWNFLLRFQVKKRTRELARLSSQFETTLLSLGDAMIATDLKGNITLMNPVAESLTGWSLEEAKGQKLTEVFKIVNALTRKPALNPVEKVLSTGKVCGLANHTKLISKTGQEYHIEDSAAPIIDQQGNPLGVVLIFRDISKEYELKEELLSQQILLEKAASLAKLIVLEIDLKTEKVRANQNAYSLLELDRKEELTLEYLLTLLTEQDKKLFREKINKLAPEDSSTFELKLNINKLNKVVLSFIEYQKEKKKLMVVAQDITEITELKEKILQSEEKYKAVFEQAPIGIMVYDKDSTIKECNDFLANIIGTTKENLLGFNLIGRVINIKLKKAIKDSLEKGIGFFEGSYTSILGNKTAIVRATFKALKRDGEIIGGIGLVEDITEIERHKEALFKKEKLESIGTLAGGIAHDFNNLLTAIFGQITLAQKKLAPSHPSFKNLEKTQATIERAQKIAGQLLSLTKGWEPIKETVDLKTILPLIAELDLSGSKVKAIYYFPEENYLVEGDKVQLEQAFSNIILNAKEAMPGGGTLTISLNHKSIKESSETLPSLPQGDYIYLEIKDTGIGIDREVLNKIFDPYFSTKKTGSGLGLAIVHSIIEKHKGFIFVESEKGKGTTFKIYLPASSEKKLASQRAKKTQEHTLKKARILFLDDEEVLQETFKELLESYGYEVETASTGEEALEKYKKSLEENKPFHVTIMDLTIPGGMGGKEVIPHILALNPEALCIISSGYSHDPVLANYQDYGFKAALQKPFEIEKLLELLDKLL